MPARGCDQLSAFPEVALVDLHAEPVDGLVRQRLCVARVMTHG